MGNTLCIIDDGFMTPASARGVERHKHFSISTIEVFLGEEWGAEHALKSLCDKLINDEDESGQKKWRLTAFTNPHFFDDTFDDENFRSDVVIFDWEYHQLPDFDQINFLRELLTKTHAHIFIFSGQDQEEHIISLLDEELSEYKDKRIFFLNKDNDADYAVAASNLQGIITEAQERNFSFKFGKELRKITNQSLDDVLFHLSEMNIEKIIEHFGEEESEPIDSAVKELIGVKIKDKIAESNRFQEFLKKSKLRTLSKIGQFAEIISEKIKNDIIQAELPHVPEEAAGEAVEDPALLEKLWSYRLYHYTDDGFVRTGDLIRRSGEYDGRLYLVLTGPCDLHRFWKNTGHKLNVVELLDIEVHASEVKEITNFTSKINSDFRNKKFKNGISSLTNKESLRAISGKPIMVPYVPFKNENIKKDFLLFPKNISGVHLAKPTDLEAKQINERNIPLKYEHCDYELVCAISDPFLSPLVGTVISDLFGWGVPDFSKSISENLANKAKGIFE